MIVKVERCWSGNSNCSFRMTTPSGTRYIIRSGGEFWDRRAAIEAKDQIAPNEGVERSKIRFEHSN